jgi:hypothetical protein
MMGNGHTTLAEAMRAKDALMKVMSFDEIFGPPSLAKGLNRSIGVSAPKPQYMDYFIEVIAPTAIDVSHLPSEFDGVRILIVHENQPIFHLM